MSPEESSPACQIALLRRQLATAEERLERAQSFAFDLRCSTARKEGRGLWMREQDRPGMRETAWGDREGLGLWVMLKAEDVPTTPSLTPLAHDLAAVSPSHPSFAARFPPELFYHIVEHTSPSTNHSLCLVSSSVRAIASPRLYETMIVSSATQLTPFLPNPLVPLAPLNRSLTLDKVRSFDMVIPIRKGAKAVKAQSYPPVSLPGLHHLHIRSVTSAERVQDLDDDAEYRLNLSLASTFLSSLNPSSLSISTDQQGGGDNKPYWFPWLKVVSWTQSTATWTRLESVCFVNVTYLVIMRDQEDDSHIFSPSDLVSALSVSFTWTFTPRGGYANFSANKRARAFRTPVDYIILIHELDEWPCMNATGFHLDVGGEEEDRAALREDVKRLREEWRGLVRF